VILWWVGNAFLAFVALPVVMVEALRIIRSLGAVKAAARDIAGSVRSVGTSVPPLMTAVDGIASRCLRRAGGGIRCPSPE
jgi:hypothetical protein